jgi:hypothetical protein
MTSASEWYTLDTLKRCDPAESGINGPEVVMLCPAE